jgi:hypothetical protein
MIQKADQMVKKYHLNTKPVNHVVKIVYFHGNDLFPLDNWQDRLPRTLDDVSNFYREEFQRYGIDISGVPFEKKNGEYVIHKVQGDLSSRNYNTESGGIIEEEIARKTNGRINFSTDYVLIINGLCYRKDDGVYVFHSPYHGRGSFIDGVCHVADCELLDAGLLKDTTMRMVFSEMMIARKECGVAEFNSWYIGGIAHEMGHVFGLPHDFGYPGETDGSNISLMGQYGSRHFRDYLWGGKPSAFFSAAGILQMLSHPVFTQSDKLQNTDLDFWLYSKQFEKNETGILLNANFKAGVPPYGIVALLRPDNISEYFNRSFPTFIQSAGSISVELGKLSAGSYTLQLLFLFPNGAVRWFNHTVSVDNEGNAVIIDSPANNSVDIQKLYEKIGKQKKTTETQAKLEILNGILNPQTPINPVTYQGKTLYLSDAKWEKAMVGWEQPARNYFNREAEHRFFLELQGKLYAKGLYAHSPSLYVFRLGKKWNTFSAIVGLRDGAHKQGSARFTVIGDGKVIYKSDVLRNQGQEEITVDISGVEILELKADGTEGHNHNSWAIWVDPVIKK